MIIKMKRAAALGFIQQAYLMSRLIGNTPDIPRGTLIASGANGEYHPRKHTKMSYRTQQRNAAKRRKNK